MPVITISRQYGSLGDEIGRDVADRLGLRFVDREIIAEVAQRLGLPPAALAERDEREATRVSDLLRAMRMFDPATLTPPTGPEHLALDEAAYLQVIRDVILEVARSDNAVIVGRGGPFVLPRRPNILHVLVAAPFEVRIERVMEADGLDRQGAIQKVKQADASRARYIRHFYRTDWLDFNHYDLVMNTGHFTRDQAASIICAAVAPEGHPTEDASAQQIAEPDVAEGPT